jgi:TPR repeat protein
MNFRNGALGAILTCLGLCVLATPTFADNAAIEQVYKKGRVAFDAGDIVGAMPPLKQAANDGHAQAAADYAYLLEESGSHEEAAMYYRRSADKGNMDGMFGLATMHLNERAGLKRDLPVIRKLMEGAANLGHRQAIISMAEACRNGELGLESAAQNPALALSWTRKAADIDDIPSLEVMRDSYRTGQLGLAVDLAAANELDRKIKRLNGVDPDAQKSKRRSRL